MTTHGIAEDSAGAGRRAVDRSAGASRTGSVFLVLLVAAVLVAAATGLVIVGRGNAEPYILSFLAVLATVGVFSLFALAAGILRLQQNRDGYFDVTQGALSVTVSVSQPAQK